MSRTPLDLVKTSGTAAELVDRLTIAPQSGGNFRVELVGDSGGGAAGAVARSELQRILQMLQGEVVKAGWLNAPANRSHRSGGRGARAKARAPLMTEGRRATQRCIVPGVRKSLCTTGE